MKKAIIIGATSGIGKSLAELLLREDYVVGVTGRRENLFQSIELEDLSRVVFKKLDVQHLSTVAPICNELAYELGGLDLFIISAGVGDENKMLDFSIENNTVITNIQGFTCAANWAMNYFKNQGYGHLVNISSIAGIRGNGDAPAYSASKAYQINYLEGLRLHAAKELSTIKVTDVRPGFVDTEMAKGDGLFWVAPVEKASRQIFNAIKKKKKIVYITRRWRLISILLKLLPYSILKKL
jgi:short-subunit dehydrogenase